MDKRIRVGMGFHANFKVIRNLLRAGFKTKSRKRRGRTETYKASYYKPGVYIISHSYDQPKYKIGMASNSYQRLRSGYNLCFSEHKSFRIHYFIEVPGSEKKRREFETIALSRFRVDDQQQTILNNFQSLEWILKQNKDKLLSNLVEVLNNSDVWTSVYSFSERGYKCVAREQKGSIHRVVESDLKPGVAEESKCIIDLTREKRNETFAKEEEKREAQELKAAEVQRKQRISGNRKNFERIRRQQQQRFSDPLSEGIRASLKDHRSTFSARAERLARRLRRGGD